MTKKAPRMKLYSCTTEDCDEDWFVVAGTPRDARRFHEDQEGYGPGDAHAELVAKVPDAWQHVKPGWPRVELLEACGGVMVRAETPRVVRFGEVEYAEGMLEHEVNLARDDLSEQIHGDRPHRTVRVLG